MRVRESCFLLRLWSHLRIEWHEQLMSKLKSLLKIPLFFSLPNVLNGKTTVSNYRLIVSWPVSSPQVYFRWEVNTLCSVTGETQAARSVIRHSQGPVLSTCEFVATSAGGVFQNLPILDLRVLFVLRSVERERAAEVCLPERKGGVRIQ